jgi:hypothetical protein
MPIIVNYNIKPQTQGAQHANRQTGGAIQLGEVATSTASPAEGCVPTGLTGDFRAGAMHPASVLGTGDNPDLVVNGAEAV